MNFTWPSASRLCRAFINPSPPAIATSMIDILENTPEIPQNCQWCTFLRNHDELTVEMVTEEEREFLWNFYAPEAAHAPEFRHPPPFGAAHGWRTPYKIELLYAILFSLPGALLLSISATRSAWATISG